MIDLTTYGSMFVQNKHYHIYVRLINKAVNENRIRGERYYELHHVVPRSIDPSVSDLKIHPENGVLLTAKEHIVAHHLLCRFTTDENRIKAIRAFHSMCFQNNGGRNQRRPSLGQLAQARVAQRKVASVKTGIKGPPKWSGCQSIDEFLSILKDRLNESRSDPEIASEFGVSATAIHGWRQKLGSGRRRENLRSKEWLQTHYIEKKMSAEEIGVLLNCSGTAVQQYLVKFNIPVRDVFERQKLAGPKRKGRPRNLP